MLYLKHIFNEMNLSEFDLIYNGNLWLTFCKMIPCIPDHGITAGKEVSVKTIHMEGKQLMNKSIF